jgi:hypothetical protein
MNLTLRKGCDRCGWQNAVRVQWLTLEGQAQWPCQACGQPLKASAWQAIYDEHSPRDLSEAEFEQGHASGAAL